MDTKSSMRAMPSLSCNQTLPYDLKANVPIGIAVSAGISATACSVAVILLLWQRMYCCFTHRMVLYLLLHTTVNALNFILRIAGVITSFIESKEYTSLFCPFHGFLTLYFASAQLLMQTGLTFHIGCLVVLVEVRCIRPLGHHYLGITSAFESEGSRNAKRYAVCLELVYALAPVLIPLLFAWVPFTTDDFGPAGLWCWIRRIDEESCELVVSGVIEQYTLWYGPLTVITLINTTVIIITIVTICKKVYHFKKSGETPTGYKNTLKQVLPILAYPIIFQVENWVALANRVGNLINSAKVVPLLIMHSILIPSNGLFAAITFFVYFAVWKKHAMDSKKRLRAHSDLPPLEDEGRSVQSHTISNWIDYEEYTQVTIPQHQTLHLNES